MKDAQAPGGEGCRDERIPREGMMMPRDRDDWCPVTGMKDTQGIDDDAQ